MEASNYSNESTFMKAVQFIFAWLVTDIRQISAGFMEKFDVLRIVYLKKSPKEKTLLKSAVVVFKGPKNWRELRSPSIKIGGVSMQVNHITMEDAEDLIDQKKTKLYVGNIPFPVDNLALWNYFAQFGALDYSYILKAPIRNGPKGFGFVIYQKRDSARAALSVKNFIDGIKLNCKLFMNKTKLKKREVQTTVTKDSRSQAYPPTYEREKTEDEFSSPEFADFDEQPEPQIYSYQNPIIEPSQRNFSSGSYTPECAYQTRNTIPSPGSITKHQIKAGPPSLRIIQQLKPVPYGGSPAECHNPTSNSQLCLANQAIESSSSSKKGSDESARSADSKSSSVHRCGCEEEKCEECWCDMIESHYFSPPCCLCDFKPDPIKCHEFLDYIRKSQKHDNHCLHEAEGVSAPHDPWDHAELDDCVPCSKYQQLKKELQKSTDSCKKEYRLFGNHK